jgi:acyl-CoA thioester hydrolase
MISHSDYKHVIPIQIRFADVDRLDHVNNACYHSFFELGRVKYFNEILKRTVNWSEKGFVLARTEIDHIKPILLNDDVYCFTKVIKLGNKSLTVKNTLVKVEANVLVECAAGVGILVATDYVKGESIEIPDGWRELILSFEGAI